MLELIDGEGLIVAIEVEEPVDLVALNDMQALLFLLIIECGLNSIANCSPIGGAQHHEAHLGLQVGLIKTWEHSEAMERLKLRVQILLLIF